MNNIKKITIIGLGLMGGSLGLALKRAQKGLFVAGYARRRETRDMAIAMEAVDEAFDNLADAVRDADIAVFCVPVLTIPSLIEECIEDLDKKCVLTDVGSTKSTVVKDVSRLLTGRGLSFVGSHPMAGSDETGIDNAKADLYRNAVVILTPEAATNEVALQKITSMWELVGAEIEVMIPDAHDAIIAKTSHLPHVIASLLVKAVLEADSRGTAKFCGSGFRDTTRIASGSEILWHDILMTNSVAIMDELAAFSEHLDKIRKMIAESDFEGIRTFFADTRKLREILKR